MVAGQLGGRLISEAVPAPGDVLIFDGSLWRPGTLPSVLGQTWLQRHLNRATLGTGLPTGQMSYLFDEFVDLSQWEENNPGTAQAITAAEGGAVLLPNDILFPPGTGAGTPFLGIPIRQPWYVAARAAFIVPYSTGFTNGVAIIDPTGGAMIIGFGSAIFGGIPSHGFIATDGITPVAWNVHDYPTTSVHDYEVWYDGALFWSSLDHAPPVSQVLPLTFNFVGVPLAGAFDFKATPFVAIDKALFVFPEASP